MRRIPAGAWATIVGGVAATSLLIARPVHTGLQPPIDGFTAAHVSAQQNIERMVRRFPSARRIDADHQFLTAEPHPAGSPRDRTLAEWTRDQWLDAGLDDVQIVEHQVLLPHAREATVEMVVPRRWTATLRERPGDPLAFHAYGASGDVTALVVDAAGGTPSDFDRLIAHGIDVRGKIALVRNATPDTYRGYAVYVAQQRGVRAVLMYSDSNRSDADTWRGPAYPAGRWAPEEGIQRGSVAFGFIAPGDPLTPGWASRPGVARVSQHEAPALPAIMSIPISMRDAATIRDAVREEAVTLHVRVSNDDAIGPVWTVIGRINGSRSVDQWVIAGNHRDAWLYGGVDPSSGSAVLTEMARALGSLVRSGVRPRRTIMLASWDAEEFALTSSTEWGEEHEQEVREHAVAYLNVDAAVSGPDFFARAVPSLAHAVAAAAGVPDSTIDSRLGAGSDYGVFLNFIGVPVVDMRFQGPYGVYHSAYDTHEWVSRFADPHFLRHAELTRIWTVLTLRLANADLLPLDETHYAAEINNFMDQVSRRGNARLERAFAALTAFADAAHGHALASHDALARGDTPAIDTANRALMRVEPALLDTAGLRGRPWYRHLIFAPAFTYKPEVLPGIAEAVDDGVPARVAEEERRLAAALERAAQALTASP